MVGKSIAARVGASVCVRAAVSATQPVAAPAVVIGLRYTLAPIWRTLAMVRIGEALASTRSMVRSISSGTV